MKEQRREMPTYKLHDFDRYGRAEITRLIFAASGTEFEDVQIKKDDWPGIKYKSPTGQLPYLEIDGKVLSQSLSIARYIAKVTGMAGKDDFEQARVEEIVEHWMELQYGRTFSMAHFESASTREEMLKKEKEVARQKKLLLMEELLKKNGDGDGFFVGKDLTWADLQSILVVQFLLDIAWDEVKNFPKVYAHYNRVTNFQKIADYLKCRPKLRY